MTTRTNTPDGHLAGYRTLTGKRQLTLPKAVTDAVGIFPHSKVVVTAQPDGSLSIRPATAADLAALPYRGKPKAASR